MSYTGFYVFGDSLVDAGNALKLAQWYGTLTLSDLPEGAPAASRGYYAGRFSNGLTYADLLSNKLIGVTTKPIFPYFYEDPWIGAKIAPFASDPSGNNLNFAYGGAQIRKGAEVVPDLDGQTDAFRHAVDFEADPNAMILVTMGGNDIRSMVTSSGVLLTQSEATPLIEKAAARMYQELGQLIDIGVQHILVTGVPDVGLIPRYDVNGDGVLTGDELLRSQTATDYARQLDTLIQQQLDLLGAEYPGVEIVYVSLFDAVEHNLRLLEQLIGRPIDPTADAELLFFDQIHPNAQSHALLAAAISDQMAGVLDNDRLPLTAPDLSRVTSIARVSEVDTIVVSLAANTTYTFEMLGVSSQRGDYRMLADPTLRVLSPNGIFIGGNDDGGLGLDATFTFTTATAGDYVIQMSAVGALTGTYRYQLNGTALGNDTYVVSHGNALILERSGEGNDTVRTSVSYALASGVSVELLTTINSGGTAALNLAGNSYAQIIVGNAGSNVIDGKGGNDVITTGTGADKVAFTSPFASSNIDRITDFSPKADTILLDDAVFAGLTLGNLASGAFALGSVATQADDRVLYDPKTGWLYFDVDGSGGASAVHFATLVTNLSMTSSDFVVI